MKRRVLLLLTLCAALSVMIAGCREGSAPGEIKLPETLKVAAKLPEEYPGQVTAYRLTWYEADERRAVDAFMHTEPQEREEQATGPIFRTHTESFPWGHGLQLLHARRRGFR